MDMTQTGGAEMNFSEAVIKALDVKHMSRKEFEHRGGFSRAYVTMLLNGSIVDPKFSRAKEVCDALGMTLDEFDEIYSKTEH
jgi:transcriptional regulator with XRE-family HTH domain